MLFFFVGGAGHLTSFHSLKPSGFNTSANRKLPFSDPFPFSSIFLFSLWAERDSNPHAVNGATF